MTPDELRIEILEDKNQKFPIRHHHVHFGVPESAIPQIQAWNAARLLAIDPASILSPIAS